MEPRAVSVFWRKAFDPAGIQTPDVPARNLVTVPITLSKHHKARTKIKNFVFVNNFYHLCGIYPHYTESVIAIQLAASTVNSTIQRYDYTIFYKTNI